MIRHAEKMSNGAAQDLKVQGPWPLDQNIGKQEIWHEKERGKADLSIYREIEKYNEIKRLGEGQG